MRGELARHADDLAALCDAEGIGRVTVLGHAGGELRPRPVQPHPHGAQVHRGQLGDLAAVLAAGVERRAVTGRMLRTAAQVAPSEVVSRRGFPQAPARPSSSPSNRCR